MKRGNVALTLVIAAICCGCIENTSTSVSYDKLDVRIDYPSEVYSGETFRVYLDILNHGNLTYKSLGADFFNTGSFTRISDCKMHYGNLEANGMASLECKLNYSREIENSVAETIDARIFYTRNMTASLAFPVLSRQEYDTRRQLGTYSRRQTGFSQSNNEISIEMELSENPLVDFGGEKYLYFTIYNMGDGLIEEIQKKNVVVWSVPYGIVNSGDCSIPPVLFHDRGKFTKIACRLHPESVKSGFENAFVFIDVMYDYEIRKTASISVRR